MQLEQEKSLLLNILQNIQPNADYLNLQEGTIFIIN